jgi:hypothetical protein
LAGGGFFWTGRHSIIVAGDGDVEEPNHRHRRLLRARRERPSQPMPHGLREAIESYRRRTAAGAK